MDTDNFRLWHLASARIYPAAALDLPTIDNLP